MDVILWGTTVWTRHDLPTGLCLYYCGYDAKRLQIHLNDTVTVAALRLRAICRLICGHVDIVIIMTIAIMINGAVWMRLSSVALV